MLAGDKIILSSSKTKMRLTSSEEAPISRNYYWWVRRLVSSTMATYLL